MDRKAYKEAKILLVELSTIKSQMIDRNEMDTDKYKEVRKKYNELRDAIDSYEYQLTQELIKNNLPRNAEDCIGMLDPEMTYSIGIHKSGMNNNIMSDPSKYAESIFQKGLISARREGGGVLENVYMLGTSSIHDKIKDSIQDLYQRAVSYDLGGLVVAIPSTLMTGDDKRVGIGEFPDDLDFVAKDDKRTSNIPINNLVKNTGYLPPEFILGIVSHDEDGNICFKKNNKFISLLPVQEQVSFYNRLLEEGLKSVEVIEHNK